MRFEEVLVPVGVGSFGESLLYEKAYKLEDGTIIRKEQVCGEDESSCFKQATI